MPATKTAVNERRGCGELVVARRRGADDQVNVVDCKSGVIQGIPRRLDS